MGAAVASRASEPAITYQRRNVIMAPHGGDPAGLFIIRGAHQNLLWMLDGTEFQEHNMRAMYCLTNYAVLPAFGGPLVPEVMKMWAKALPQ